MSSVQNEKVETKESRPHESGALAAWCMIAGAILGLVVGVFLGKYLLPAFSGGLIGWFVGALIERARR
ncbi:MAG TPA: hypothetical protein VHD62_08580 [Opitutaceae bacterium]|nr:hypothetical protein [Opitutaceae bacterium]